MKKKIILISSFLFLVTIFFSNKTLAQEPTSELTPTQTATKEAAPVYTKYDLAYPGMLPDNPLYKIKVLRDKISLNFMSDPYKKIDFYLLQTDKGMLATAMLIDKNKIDLAEKTSLKAEHNYTLLVNEFKETPNKPNAQVFKKLKTASFKHQEILTSIIKRLPSDKQKTFKIVLDFSKRNLQTLEKMEKKNEKRWTDWSNSEE